MEKVSFVLGALLKHENEQKKKISHACKEKDLSLSKYSCKKTIKKKILLMCAMKWRIKSPWFPGLHSPKRPPDHRFHCYMKIRGRGG